MTTESLDDKINRIGSAVEMLRNAQAGAFEIPGTGEFGNWRDEQAAWKKTAVVFDQSFHMTDVYFTGPDVRRLLSDTGVNGFGTFGRNKAKQFVACNEDGHVVGDSILFGFEDDEVSLVGRPAIPNWVAYRAETGGYDVTVSRDERTLANKGLRRTFRYQLQGPNAGRVVEKAHGGPIARIKFFQMGEFSLAGCPVRALNHTMSGIPGEELTGLELIGPAEQGPEVMEALVQAGGEFGLVRGGAIAYPTTTFESGWIPSVTPAIYSGDAMKPYRQWLGADSWEASISLGGSFESADIADYYQTPWELGYGHLVKFDHDFIGRSALEKLADGPHRRKVWLRWNDDDVQRVIASSLFDEPGTGAKYLDTPKTVYSSLPFDQVLIGDRLVGLSTYAGYTVNVGGWLSLAMLDEADIRDGAEVTVVWGESGGGSRKPTVERHVQTHIRATISSSPLV
ncbi:MULTISPECIES: hypothetical protein [unclassified Mycobacterium]|uniref:hypothetical protein n=1 Tax=unclassified Mycobacterium TaxID=2642494 RepID=UPI0029C8BC44|nr:MULTISPECIES: hypothetical protein [unclassified Mycobacterium]